MMRMLQLPDKEFKITIFNMLKSVMEKSDSMKEQLGNGGDGNFKEESKGNSMNQHRNRNEECLPWAHQ